MRAEKVSWDEETDVVVVGFGGAGACAAIEAIDNGADVTIVERFNGGGATSASGGVVYLGAGTEYQNEAGFDDSPDNMFEYLKVELGDAVSVDSLRAFCDESVEDLQWLEKNGVPFGGDFCPFKTSYPVDQYTLYYSGNEPFPPFSQSAKPAPRGHRTKGKGMPGRVLFNALNQSVRQRAATIHHQTRATELIVDSDGNVVGLGCRRMPRISLVRLFHWLLSGLAFHLRYLILALPFVAHIFKGLFWISEWRGRRFNIRAKKGVILSTGGFIHNRKMVAQCAPAYAAGTPLGTLGDDGSGIALGQSVGGVTGLLDQASSWRFINPPNAFVSGILVDRQGKRVCNEQLYGAAIGKKMAEDHNGEALLIIDRTIFRRSFADLNRRKARWFQSMPALVNLFINRKKSSTLERLAKRCKIPVDNLKATIDTYNDMAMKDGKDAMGKSADVIHPLSPPFYAINCSLGSRLFACATITLGGLCLEASSGQVQGKDGSSIKGLYAAGRTAVGITSGGYVSGLSIADAVFSGRRAGRHCATQR